MNARTALEIALDLDAASCSSFVKLEAAAMLRRQHAEIERLKADADRVNSCAKNLAIAMHRKNFSNITQWEPLPDTMGLISQIDNMSCWHDAEIDRLKRERHHIYDLLARIHRDGGQYTAEHGVEKACDDAEAQVVAWLETINGIDALIEQARIAEREVGDMNKHTPGSWRRMGDIVAQDGTTIAIVSPRYDGDEWAANSMLIAAAPDLLEVCRRLSHVNLFAVDEDVASIIMLALDTVQKATGEKP